MNFKKYFDRVQNSGTALVILFIASLLFFYFISDIVFTILGGIIIAIILSTLISFTSRKTNLSWMFSFIIVLFIVLIVLGSISYYLSSTIISQSTQLFSEISSQATNLLSEIETRFGISISNLDFFNLIRDVLSNNLIFSVLTYLSLFLIAIFLGIYFSYSPNDYFNDFNKNGKMKSALLRSRKELKNWVIGTLYSMIIIGTVTTIALLILDVRYAIVLGLLAGLLEFIPYVGPIISWVPAFIITVVQDPILGAYITILYIGIQQLESHLVVPIVQKRMVYLEPGYILIAELFFGLIFGFFGLLFAVPTVVVLRAIYQELRK